MDRSLIFFYCFFGLLLLHLTRIFLKDKYKWQNILFNFSAAINCFTSSYFFATWSAGWWILVSAGTFVLLSILQFIYSIFKKYRAKKHCNKIIKEIHNIPSRQIVNTLMVEHNQYQWYVLYLPSANTIELGVNLFGIDLTIDKKFYVRTLSERYMYFIPSFIPASIDDSTNIICLLKTFYELNEKTQELVLNYIDAVKHDIKEPWIISQPVP